MINLLRAENRGINFLPCDWIPSFGGIRRNDWGAEGNEEPAVQPLAATAAVAGAGSVTRTRELRYRYLRPVGQFEYPGWVFNVQGGRSRVYMSRVPALCEYISALHYENSDGALPLISKAHPFPHEPAKGSGFLRLNFRCSTYLPYWYFQLPVGRRYRVRYLYR